MNSQKIQSNSNIKYFHELLGEIKYGWQNLQLVGGAVIDILEDRKPKDFDFIKWSENNISTFVEAGFEYQYETKSAKTYKKGDITIQFINTPLENFDFKISQAYYDFKAKTLTIDEISFDNKILIPVCFENKRNAFNSLRRIPHWKNKGYKINDMTYLSLLNVVSKSNRNINS